MSAVTCPGRCCEAISLSAASVSRLELRPRDVEDGAQVRAMLVPLPAGEARAIVERNGGKFRGDLHWFACLNWSPKTRLCGIYGQRPAMCRDYPYGRSCDFGCPCEGTPRHKKQASDTS